MVFLKMTVLLLPMDLKQMFFMSGMSLLDLTRFLSAFPSLLPCLVIHSVHIFIHLVIKILIIIKT